MFVVSLDTLVFKWYKKQNTHKCFLKFNFKYRRTRQAANVTTDLSLNHQINTAVLCVHAWQHEL